MGFDINETGSFTDFLGTPDGWKILYHLLGDGTVLAKVFVEENLPQEREYFAEASHGGKNDQHFTAALCDTRGFADQLRQHGGTHQTGVSQNRIKCIVLKPNRRKI